MILRGVGGGASIIFSLKQASGNNNHLICISKLIGDIGIIVKVTNTRKIITLVTIFNFTLDLLSQSLLFSDVSVS